MLRLNQPSIPSPRALLLIVLMLGTFAMGVATYTYAQGRIAAVESIRANGGEVVFYSLPDSYSEWLPVPEWLSAPEWLRRAFSVEVIRGHFNLTRIASLRELEVICVADMDDLGIESAPRFQRLKAAHFIGRDVRITDTGMATLGKCRQLEILTVESTRITDAGLSRLAGLPLKSLNVSQAPITDAGLQYISGLPLERLTLDRTLVTDAGLKVLAGLPLKSLSLDRTRVTDRGLQSISGLELTTLSLDDTRVTDCGMLHLVGMPLTFLSLVRTSVGATGAMQLKDLDKLAIYLGPRAGIEEELKRATGMENILVRDW